ncbi:MAG: transketolase C-terminal domain-containing protein, partial [Christensenella sp.]
QGQRLLPFGRELYIEAEDMRAVNDQLQAKYAEITNNETRVQEIMTEDADYIIAAFGTTARIAKNAALKAREMGIKVGIIRPITLWPFPSEAFAKAAKHVKGMLCVEMNTGQMIEDVRLAVNGEVPIEFYGTTGGFVPTPDAVIDALVKLKEGK